MRISDWSSDVCSSDLHDGRGRHQHALIGEPVGLFIAGIAVVPFDPAPVDLVSLRGSIERLPQILVLDRLPVGSLPATRLPVRHPLCQALHDVDRSEEHTSELQSLMRISYAVFCLKKKITKIRYKQSITNNK